MARMLAVGVAHNPKSPKRPEKINHMYIMISPIIKLIMFGNQFPDPILVFLVNIK